MSRNKKILSFIAATLFGAASFTLYSTGVMAGTTSVMPLTAPNANSQMMKIKPAKCHARVIILRLEKKHRPALRLGLAQNKHLTSEDARTIIKAVLLLKNRHDLNVGKIENLRSPRGKMLYIIPIVNHKDDVVSKVIMNSTSGKFRPLRVS